jgi:endonuclease/exonuclease/phosphatase family metal-dependent hydrolase
MFQAGTQAGPRRARNLRRHPRYTGRMARGAFFLAVASWTFAAACGQGSTGTRPDGTGDDASAPGDDAAATADASPVDAGEAAAADQAAGARVRVMAANLTSGTQQSYEAPGVDILQGLRADVVLIQEFKVASGDLRGLVDTAFGKDFSFYVEPTGSIPNGVISRFPILESGEWADASVTDRAFAYARIDVPGPIDLWAVSVHLLTTSATARGTEAAQLLGYVQSKVPAGDYLVVGGDFNTDVASEPAIGTLAAAVVTAAPYPADQSGNANSSINRNHPHDWVLAAPALDARELPVMLGANAFPAGLIFDSRVYSPLGDVPPVVATDSGASGMQHMAVVRDFAVGP